MFPTSLHVVITRKNLQIRILACYIKAMNTDLSHKLPQFVLQRSVSSKAVFGKRTVPVVALKDSWQVLAPLGPILVANYLHWQLILCGRIYIIFNLKEIIIMIIWYLRNSDKPPSISSYNHTYYFPYFQSHAHWYPCFCHATTQCNRSPSGCSSILCILVADE